MLLAGLLLAAGCRQSDDKKSRNPLFEEEQESVQVRPEVIFAVADDQPLYRYIESTGVVEANQHMTLKPRVSGYIEYSAQLLRPGMTVEGAIRVEEISGKARVPRSAILSRDGGRTLLFKLQPENDEVNWIYVNPTAQNADWAIIDHEDVAPGDTIAVERHFALSHLQIVTPKMQLSPGEDGN